jgi:hypothetical protein
MGSKFGSQVGLWMREASWHVPGFGAGAAFFLAFGGRFIAQVPFGICVSTRAGCSGPSGGTGFCARHAAILCGKAMQAGRSGSAREHYDGIVPLYRKRLEANLIQITWLRCLAFLTWQHV